jgi:hypothetical protein
MPDQRVDGLWHLILSAIKTTIETREERLTASTLTYKDHSVRSLVSVTQVSSVDIRSSRG